MSSRQSSRDTGSQTVLAEDNETNIADVEMSRRGAMRLGAATAAAAVGITAMSAPAAARTIDYDASTAHDPWMHGSLVVEQHETGMLDLDYIDNEDSIDSLRDWGYVLDLPDDDREDRESPTNAIRVNPADIKSDDFVSFPAEEDDIVWTETQYWSGSLDIEEDGDGLRFWTEAVDGTSSAVFDDFNITQSVRRRKLQLIVSVHELASDGSIEITLSDDSGAGTVAKIDPSGDTDAPEILADSIGRGQLIQVEVGELNDEMDSIDEISVSVVDADADLTIHALSLDNTSEWELGEGEALDEDDNVVVEPHTHSTGSIGLTSIESLSETDTFEFESVSDVEYDVVQRAAELPSDEVLLTIDDAEEDDDHDADVDIVYRFATPDAYDLSGDLEALLDEIQFDPDEYHSVEVATGSIDTIESSEDAADVAWTDVSQMFEDGEIEDEIEILTEGETSVDDAIALRYQLNLSDDQVSDLTMSASGGGVVAAGREAINRTRGVIAGVMAGLLVYVGLFRDHSTGFLARLRG